MENKICKHCGKNKSLNKFNSNGWCKDCMKKYLRAYKSKRLDFSETILTDKAMAKEMRSIKQIDTKGLNALEDYSKQFEYISKNIKSFNNIEIKKSLNAKRVKAIYNKQIINLN